MSEREVHRNNNIIIMLFHRRLVIVRRAKMARPVDTGTIMNNYTKLRACWKEKNQQTAIKE